MKKQDFIFIIFILILFLPFVLISSVYNWYEAFNASHGMVMSFIKFALLSTIGEMIGFRITKGVYMNSTFGVMPRMIIWGVLGLFINGAMLVFSKGIPLFLEYMGMDNASHIIGGDFSAAKVFVALCISVAMNSFFAPVFMTFHKITDTHIANNNGSIKALFTPIPVTRIITTLNWNVQWNLVFKKTIPLFWYPAHTITFLLPPNTRVLFAALLGVVLGVLLSLAANKK